MPVEDLDNIKKKFWAKVLSQDAISITFQRSLDLQKVFADYIWLQVSAFDLSQLGLGLANNIAPVDMHPLSIDYKAELALVNETLQGIWMNFTPVDYGELYPWMKDLRTFIEENISEEFKAKMKVGIGVKGFYGITPYERSIYDPVIAREFLRATAHRLRLMKTSDKLYAFIIDKLKDYLEMTGATTDIIYNKIMLLMTAQTQTFILGLSLLGKSKLTHVEDGLTQVTYEDAKGNLVTAKIGNLDHIQFGFILGISPLGYGFLLPQKSIYKLPEGKKNPPIVNVIWNKIQGMKNRLVYLAWAFANYNRPDEMQDYHASERTQTYMEWHYLRRQIEDWTLKQLGDEARDPMRIRQYQNAMLMLISWQAKRHKWGYNLFQKMTEEQFFYWWVEYWKSQGLNEAMLKALYEGFKIWLKTIREKKLYLGMKTQLSRRRLALT